MTGFEQAAGRLPSIVKAPAAVLDYAEDWSAWLAPQETILSATWTVSAGLVIERTVMSSTQPTAWLSGGTVGEQYICACTITTNQQRTDTRSFRVIVAVR